MVIRGKEKFALRELVSLLSCHADTVMGEQAAATPPYITPSSPTLPLPLHVPLTIEEELKQELISLKQLPKRFYGQELGIDCLLFIKSHSKTPTREIFEVLKKDLVESGLVKTRHCLRLVPIHCTCKAFMDDMIAMCERECVKVFGLKTDPGYFNTPKLKVIKSTHSSILNTDIPVLVCNHD